MNRYKMTAGIAALALVASVGGCDEGLTDLNENPNEPTEVPAQFLFAQATQSGVERVFGRGMNMNIGSTWAQHIAMIQYPNEDRYQVRPGDVDAFWDSFYAGSLKDLQTIIESAQEAEQPNYVGVAKILRAWEFGIMTDIWGDIPYTAALPGETTDEAALQPKYDPQSSIYPALIQELADAVGMLDAGEDAITDQDLLYGGDVEAWAKFANSLRLRLGMRLSEVDPGAAEAAVKAAYDAGVFASNDEMAVFSYEGSAQPNENPWYEDHFGGRDDHAISKTLVDTLLALADPRIAIYADPIAADTIEEDGWTYIGQPNGSTAKVVSDSVSRIGKMWRKEPDAPFVLMSYAEVLFLEAEAAQRGWIAGDAEALYEAAIRASMEQYGIEDADIDAYLAQPRVAYNGLESIALQKWIALYANGLEAYAEWRRTGVPELEPGVNNLNNGLIPVRLPYPSGEQTLNSESLNAALSAQGMSGPGDYNVPVWWDAN